MSDVPRHQAMEARRAEEMSKYAAATPKGVAEEVRRQAEEMSKYVAKGGDVKHKVSAPALHAARVLLANFNVAEKQTENQTIPVSEFNIAVLIDICTDVFRLVPFRTKVGDLAARVGKGEVKRAEVYQLLSELSQTLNRLPSY